MKKSRKLILLGGMTPGGRIYRRLTPLISNYEFIEWVNPGDDQTVQEYAYRIKKLIKDPQDCDVLGVSFGGIVAQELARIIEAERCYIVSSLCCYEELNLAHKTMSKVPPVLLNQLLASSVKMFSTLQATNVSKVTSRLKKLVGDEGGWYRWAALAVAKWKPSKDVGSDVTFIRIHGDSDSTFKRGHIFSDYVIEGATHVLALTHAKELAQL